MLTYTVAEYEPGQRILLEGGNDSLHTRDEMTLVETPTGGITVTTSSTSNCTASPRPPSRFRRSP
jgi:hypothetical protein